MQDWQQRVIEEQADLAGKIERLTAFVNSKAFSFLAGDDKDLLNMQLKYMNTYDAVLRERIKRFK